MLIIGTSADLTKSCGLSEVFEGRRKTSFNYALIRSGGAEIGEIGGAEIGCRSGHRTIFDLFGRYAMRRTKEIKHDIHQIYSYGDWQLGMRRHFLDEDALPRYMQARIDVIKSIGELAPLL